MLHVRVFIYAALHLLLDPVDLLVIELVVSLVQLNVQTLVELVLVATSGHGRHKKRFLLRSPYEYSMASRLRPYDAKIYSSFPPFRLETI